MFIVQGDMSMGACAPGLAAALNLAIIPGLASLDAMMFGTFGLGPMKLDLQAQLDAAININLSWDPMLAITGMANCMAAIQANLLPQVDMSASASAKLAPMIGGINLLIDAALQVKVPMLQAQADMNAFISGPAIRYAVWTGTSGQVSSELAGFMAATGSGQLYALVLVSSSPSFQTSIQGLFKVS